MISLLFKRAKKLIFHTDISLCWIPENAFQTKSFFMIHKNIFYDLEKYFVQKSLFTIKRNGLLWIMNMVISSEKKKKRN